ncbi:PEP/pyruvate-binding domain-containing protein [Natranaerofaba carboxydovora]|uniref:PEP/pyruvate-binding domain-containing protein n=1 Tax=Natranaerofaba carboxydovora TaxID=2742683 RepID=UPI001F1474F1|nr:PEP/pyruvate-binding domain-containing protein [Natranaerofaba carboxydovora]UMZ72795.1 Phosphoenolpyruvate synthase [Natranaerofaba carboxydovora]
MKSNEQKYVKSLEDVTKKDFLYAGGKGTNLGEMITAGLPIPEGFVVLTNAYRRFVEGNNLAEKIKGLLSDIEDLDNQEEDSFSQIERISQKIKRLFEAGKIPDDIIEDINYMYEVLGEASVAVRSSATAEDLPGTSFAGQYNTYLNIRGREQLHKSVKDCWASLWNARALSYRVKQNIKNEGLAHGVVVQKLIDAEKSGILFTANPVNGRRDQMLLNSSWGLGEAIVGGEVTPDQWVMDKKNKKILEEKIAKKEIMTIRNDKGIEFVEVTRKDQESRTLDSNEVMELLELGDKVEKYFSSPQDIEWAYRDGKFYLVQSRPITSLYPLPQPEDYDKGLRIYMNFNLYSQAMPEPFTPVGEAMFKEMFVGVSKLVNKDYKRKPVNWVKSAGGRVFLDVTEPFKYERIQERLKNNPADKDPVTIRTLIELIDKNKDELLKNKKSAMKILTGIITKMNPWVIKFCITSLYKVMYGVISPQKAVSKSYQYGENFVSSIENKKKELKTIEEKINYIANESPKELFIGLFEVVFYVSASSTYLDRAEKIMKKHLEDTSELDKVEKSVPNSVTTEMGMELLGIVKKLAEKKEEPTLDHPEVKNFLNKYGHRSSLEVDLGIPRWYEEPQYVLNLIESYIENKNYDEGLDKFQQGKKEAEEAIVNITNKIKEKGANRDAKKVEKLLRNFREMFGIRELPKFYLTKSFGILREMLMDIGEELKREGRLEDKKDIFYLRFDEITSDRDLREIVDKNKEKYQRDLQMNAPLIMTSTGESIYSGLSTEKGEEGTNYYIGLAVSPGIYEGRVKVLNRPEEGKKLKKGEILVTKGTNPAWTPLFLKIGGLVMETGGPISHGSVVAREYGVPAVAGVREATTKLQDGQLVRINGETGSVEVIEE